MCVYSRLEMPQNCCRSLQHLVWRVFFCGKNWDCLSTLWPSGGVGVACEAWRAPVVGTADAAVCAVVRVVLSLASDRRPSESPKLTLGLWLGVGGRACCASREGLSSGVMPGACVLL